MKYGRFENNGRDYVITNPETPAPWINYLFGDKLSAFVSQAAGGMLWYEQPYYGRLTRYRFNGLPMDSPGFLLYINDGDQWWNPSFFPTTTPLDEYECRHSPGKMTFSALKNNIRCDYTLFISDDDVMIWDISLENLSDEPREIRVRPYVEFSLLEEDKDTQAFLTCGNQARQTFDSELNSIKYEYFAFESRFMGKTLFAASDKVTGFELDRDKFIGKGRTETNPVGLTRELSNTELPDGGPYACGVMECVFKLKAGEKRRTHFSIATAESFEESEALTARYTESKAIDDALARIAEKWDKTFATAQVSTGDEDFDNLVNTWFPINIKTTMRASRSISTRHTGTGAGIRYRDTMQDLMPASQLFPEEFERKILKTFSAMTSEGRTITSIDPKTLRSKKVDHTRIDAALWGVMTTYRHLAESGDLEFLNRVVPYYDSGSGTILEHLIKGMRFIGDHTGAHGLPLLFDTDWNDMLQVFSSDKEGGESIMVAEQFIHAANLMLEILDAIGVTDCKEYLLKKRTQFTDILNSDVCWDGKWFKRLLFKDSEMGASHNDEARIFLNTQSWAVIAGTLDPEKTRTAMNSVHKMLATEYGIRLFAPPITHMPESDRPFNTNTPGAGENGGIFLHANTWAIIAETLLGNNERAFEYFSSILSTKRNKNNPELYA
ncbi:MAG: hypothetical protein KAG97_06265, partial [Victivallales bacterium]|nr:hypothetical protein [Victivallales bacterium]